MSKISARLREAHAGSMQRAVGSDILLEGANEIDRLEAWLFRALEGTMTTQLRAELRVALGLKD